MKKRVILSLLLIAVLVLSACTTTATTTAPTTAGTTSGTTAGTTAGTTTGTTVGTTGGTTAGTGPYDKLDKIYIGVTAPMTGTNKLVGDYVINGAKLAAEEINAKGGLLGKQIELVMEDEVDNQQASVNAMTKLLNNSNISAMFGSTYSAYCIGVSPTVKEKKIPFMAGGSSANIPKENNMYMWQARMTDDKSGQLLATAATQTLKMKNPAILHITDSFGTGLKDQTLAALKNMGIEVAANNVYGHNADEKQFTPIINQIMNSDVDGLIAISHQVPAALIMAQADSAGLDLPRLGSSSFGSAVARQSSGAATDGWYAVSDWTVEVTTPVGKAFAEAYQAKYNQESDMPAVTAYDSIKLLAEAIKMGNSVEPATINENLGKITNLEGAMSTYKAQPNRCFSTSQFLTLNKDGKATMVEVVKVQ